MENEEGRNLKGFRARVRYGQPGVCEYLWGAEGELDPQPRFSVIEQTQLFTLYLDEPRSHDGDPDSPWALKSIALPISLFESFSTENQRREEASNV